MTAFAGCIWVRTSACSLPAHTAAASMKPSLQFRLSQHLTLTPQLQQSIRLLQLSTVELNQEIERILMENPALEREDRRGTRHRRTTKRRARHRRGARRLETPRVRGNPAPPRPRTGRAKSPPTGAARDDDEDGDRTHATPDTPTLRDHLRSAALAHQPRRARPRLRRAADRRARRRRLPHPAARGDRRNADAAASG